MSLNKENKLNFMSILFLFTIVLLVQFFMVTDVIVVIFPVILISVNFIVFLVWMRSRVGGNTYINLGSFYVLVVSVYIILPLIGFMLNGLKYGLGNSNRLVILNPTPEQVGFTGLYGAIYIIIFSLGYCFFCNKSPDHGKPVIRNMPSRHSVIFVFVFISLFMLFISVSLGLGSKSYLDRFVAVWSLPLFIKQIANHVSGIYVISVIGVLTFCFSDYKKYKTIIIGILLYELISAIASMGGRSEIVQFLIAAGMLYHLFVKKLTGKFIIITIVAGTLILLGYGVIRSNAHLWNETSLGSSLLTNENEFESVFANALELLALRNNDKLPVVPWQLTISNLTSLIPQQLLPFEKMEYGEWFVSNLYPSYKEAGGGLAFGALAESIVGFGLPELIIRAFLLSWFFAWIHNWYLTNRDEFFPTCFYIWITVESYQCYRASSFVLLILILYRFVPYTMAIMALNSIYRRVARRAA